MRVLLYKQELRPGSPQRSLIIQEREKMFGRFKAVISKNLKSAKYPSTDQALWRSVVMESSLAGTEMFSAREMLSEAMTAMCPSSVKSGFNRLSWGCQEADRELLSAFCTVFNDMLSRNEIIVSDAAMLRDGDRITPLLLVDRPR